MESLKAEADRYFAEQSYETALKIYKKVVEEENTILPYLRLIQCHYLLKDFPGVIETTTRAIEVMEDIEDFIQTYIEFMKMLGDAYVGTGQFGLARNAYEKIIEKSQKPEEIKQAEAKIQELASEVTGIEEFNELKNLLEVTKRIEGSLWHLVSSEWYSNWESYCKGETESAPGPIDNSALIAPHSDSFVNDPLECKEYTNVVLNSGLIENKDFILLPKQAYSFLEKKYSASSVIRRWAIALDELGQTTHVEVNLKTIKFMTLPTPKTVFTAQTSRKETVAMLSEKLFRLANFPDHNAVHRLWKAPEFDPALEFSELSKLDLQLLTKRQEIEESEIADDDIIVLELKPEDAEYVLTPQAKEFCGHCKTPGVFLKCSRCRQVTYCSTQCQKSDFSMHKDFCRNIQRSAVISATVTKGLKNLCNTCFMNSALQCLAHTRELSQYFLSNRFVKDLNPENPLGTKGALVKAYLDLLIDLFTSSRDVIAPWEFKKTLNKVTNQFAGYQQHDSHELLSYVLSGLHEDLNRVKEKPYIDQPETMGKPDAEAAAESWDWFLLRNSSKIVDTMYGQYKNELVCPVCHTHSVTFDPFLTLSLPIPNYSVIEPDIFVVSGSAVVLYRVSVNASAKVRTVKNLLREQCGESVQIFGYKKGRLLGTVREDIEASALLNSMIIAQSIPEKQDGKEIVVLYINSIEKSFMETRKKIRSPMRFLILDTAMNTLDIYRNFIDIAKRGYEHDIEDLDDYFTVNIVNNSKTDNSSYIFSSKQPCAYCGSKKCDNCPLELSETLSLQDLISKQPSADDTLSFEIILRKPSQFHCQFETTSPILLRDPNIIEKPMTTLYDCITYASTPEQLDKSNEWYCRTCMKHVEALKTYQIYHAPNTLIIHLLRFKKFGLYSEKISNPVDFPLHLDLAGYTISTKADTNFELYAIVNHYGSMGIGHYTAYVKVNEDWYEFDDSKVRRINRKSLISAAAYILFYRVSNNE